ncbi:MAG: CinA-like protein, partial [Chlamydiae bacterium]|nr:CinA-like protein [Chlamydiota bacterium]
MQESIEKKIHALFIEKGWTLSCAESCTGGNLAARFVALPDCSLYFLGSVVAYANQAKVSFFRVNQKILDEYGAVSEQTAKEMAEGALKRFGSTFSVSTTGIAGPSGGSVEKPVGTVCFAIACHNRETLSWTSHFSGDRASIIAQASNEACSQLWTLA